MSHLALLGDSIFDNARYVPGGPSVIDHVRSHLPEPWRASLLAIDGDVVRGVASQLARLPADVSHLFISVGGNDALGHSGILADARRPAADGFARLAAIQEQFAAGYREMLRTAIALRKPVAVCTIYDAVPGLPREAVLALSIFNDAILRAAFDAGLPVIDLRRICDEGRDYSAMSPIEPSAIGGLKIAHAIIRVATAHDFGRRESVVYGK